MSYALIATVTALAAFRLGMIWNQYNWSRLDKRAWRSALEPTYILPPPGEPIHPDQDATGDVAPMPPIRALSLRLHAKPKSSHRLLAPVTRWRQSA